MCQFSQEETDRRLCISTPSTPLAHAAHTIRVLTSRDMLSHAATPAAAVTSPCAALPYLWVVGLSVVTLAPASLVSRQGTAAASREHGVSGELDANSRVVQSIVNNVLLLRWVSS
jgi:hypothetical protein